MGDLSCREIKPNKAIISIFSHHGDSQSGRKRSAQAAIGQAPCKPSRLSGLSPRNVRVESASIHLNEPTLVGATGRSLPCPNPDVALLGYSSAKPGRGAEIEVSSAPKSRIAELHMAPRPSSKRSAIPRHASSQYTPLRCWCRCGDGPPRSSRFWCQCTSGWVIKSSSRSSVAARAIADHRGTARADAPVERTRGKTSGKSIESG